MAAPSEPAPPRLRDRLAGFAPSLPAFALYGLAAAAFVLWTPVAAGPACPVRSVTGVKCPGCGALRASHALAHGHIAEAFAYNPALVLTLLALPAGAVGLWFARRLLVAPNYARLVRAVAWITLALLVVWTVARNLWTLDAA